MAKKGFIKIKDKKLFKYFNDKNIDKIWEFFEEHFNKIYEREIDWETNYYRDYIKGNRRVPLYPETDKWDDSIGIQAKQLFSIIDLIGFENFKVFAEILAENSLYFIRQRTSENKIFEIDEDSTSDETIISWKHVFKKYFEEKVKNEDFEYFGRLFFAHSLGKRNLSLEFTKTDFPYPIEKEIFISIIKDNLKIEKILFFKENKLYDENESLTLEKLDTEKFYKKRKELWKKEHGFQPENEKLLMLDPEFWDKDSFLVSLNRFHNTKQLRSLDLNIQNTFVQFYSHFGKMLPFVISMLKNEHIFEPNKEWPILYKKDLPQSIKKILTATQRGIDIRLKVSELIYIFSTLTSFKDSEEFILKKDRITIDDIKLLIEVGIELSKMKLEDLESIKEIPWRYIGVFKKYNISNISDVLNLYNKTKDINCNIPLIEGKYKNYSYVITGKDDIRGLIAGKATNCCQHLQSAGRSCVYYGAESEDSTFFLILDEKGTIVVQSWLWLKDNILVCDSIESVRSSQDFYKIYEMMAKEIVTKSNITEVRVGSHGSGFAQNLTRQTSIGIPDVPDNTTWPYNKTGKVYSDASTQYLIYKK